MATHNAEGNSDSRREGPTLPGRVLVIGSSEIAGATGVAWTSLQKVRNIADFPTIVISTGSLNSTIKLLDMSKELGTKDAQVAEQRGGQLSDDLYMLKGKLRQILRAGGRVFAIIHPYVSMLASQPTSYSTHVVSSYDWMPLPVSLKEEPGEGPQNVETGFEGYFSKVKHWQHVFGTKYDKSEMAPLVADQLQPRPEAKLTSQTFASDWQGHPIAHALFYTLHKEKTSSSHGSTRRYDSEPWLTSGPLVLLPPPTEATDDEAVGIIMEDFYGLQPRTPEPDFVKAVRVPGQNEIDAQIRAKSEELALVQQEIDGLVAEKARKHRFLALVYEKGIQGLQEVAREAFEEMGLNTWDADPDVSDEFMVGDGTVEVLAEVKGHRKSAQKADIRQLDESMDEYERKFGKPVKGVLVVDAWCEKPIEDRDKPETPSFPDNVIKRAQAIEASLVSGVELYNALCAVWEGRLTGKDVFSRLINGRGVTKLA